MRVHGDKILRRRAKYRKKKRYTSYKKELVEDFQNMCGYCGKDFNYMRCEHQIDHLIPVDACKKFKQENMISEYSNLVYSCRVCNRNKWNDWPLDNINDIHDGQKGYIDPATEEYDTHLKRNSNGEIIPLTSLGNYMYDIFKFEYRLTSLIWKATCIKKEIEILKKKIDKLEGEERTEYLEKFYLFQTQFDNMTNILKEKRELI
ncbi:HNH endonuclease [Vallitalea guaymasensis]|uniref:HNH endonuclease n=1 Tax=Vallitalea guaymasensis TaxID=1185412 RepID=A0A8J8SBI7_9FIRM|nr:HNH endonuclease [Vallitalea guaymasensis]QUH28823.1 HNH endonuclease [Vallitalea guaymasensis]